MTDLLLVSPPVANIGQATASISVLAASLRARGWEVGQYDASIDAFHHFHSAEHLGRCRAEMQAQGAPRRLLDEALLAERGIEEAKRRLQDPSIVRDTEAMERAFSTLQSAGVALSAAGGSRREHTFRAFDVPGAFRDWEALSRTLEDGEANPFVAWARERAVPRILERRPAAVGLSFTYLSQLIPGLTLLRALKQQAPEVKVAAGGGYLTALGEEARRVPACVLPADAVILHDGEAALDAWLRGVRRRGEPQGRPSAAAPPACVDLAHQPSPCWTADGLELSRYLVPRYAIPLPLTRGCHWGRCRYCNISAQTASRYRVRPVELALADLRAAMEETGSSWFDLPVDSFRPDHLRALARGILQEGLQIRWAAEVLLHPQLTTQTVEELARSGCRCLRFGMESASAEVLAAMNKPRPPDLAARILRDCRQAGIRTSVMNIVGFPTETARQRNETFEFLADHRDVIDFVALHEFNLVPGSPMAADPAAHGLLVLPSEAVLQPSLRYRNTNQVGLEDAEQVHEAATAMRDALREYYPYLGKPWAVAIGGWMTFAWCCRE